MVRGDILTLVMHLNNLTFPQANKYLHNLLNLKYEFNKNKVEVVNYDPLEIFKKIKKRQSALNVYDIKFLDEEILDEYLPLLHIDWVREGIMEWTRKEFNLGFSGSKKRIIIPHRYYSGTRNEYVGIIGRTIVKEWDLLDIPKYYPLKSYPKGLNLYGLQENYQYIQEAGYVVCFEAEKSTLKRHSRNDKTGVAVCGHEVTPEQVKILIGLNVDIVIAFDEGIDQNYIRSVCDKFYPIRNVSYIWDKHGLLKSKESPADKENKIYQYLFKHRIKYDESERRKYLEWQEKQVKN